MIILVRMFIFVRLCIPPMINDCHVSYYGSSFFVLLCAFVRVSCCVLSIMICFMFSVLLSLLMSVRMFLMCRTLVVRIRLPMFLVMRSHSCVSV